MSAVAHDPSRRHWVGSTRALRRELAAELDHERLRELHRKQPWKHLAVAIRQLVLLVLCTWGLWTLSNPLLWIPLALLQGLTFFNGTILLHEVLHHLVWPGTRPHAERRLGLAYAILTGISPTQFTRWHLDHHAGLGDAKQDPKRHHLSPKRNSRLLKLLYFTPALFPIYFTAARRETAGYPEPLRRRIARERHAAIAFHLLLACVIYLLGGATVMLQVHIVPLLFGFPIWFAINRTGQHYRIDPDDPACWGTLVKGSLVWDHLFLWSNYHLEHHYFPGVPFYNLPKLHGLLQPFYRRRGMRAVGYGELLWGWLVLNRPPHTDWESELAG